MSKSKHISKTSILDATVIRGLSHAERSQTSNQTDSPSKNPNFRKLPIPPILNPQFIIAIPTNPLFNQASKTRYLSATPSKPPTNLTVLWKIQQKPKCRFLNERFKLEFWTSSSDFVAQNSNSEQIESTEHRDSKLRKNMSWKLMGWPYWSSPNSDSGQKAIRKTVSALFFSYLFSLNYFSETHVASATIAPYPFKICFAFSISLPFFFRRESWIRKLKNPFLSLIALFSDTPFLSLLVFLSDYKVMFFWCNFVGEHSRWCERYNRFMLYVVLTMLYLNLARGK